MKCFLIPVVLLLSCSCGVMIQSDLVEVNKAIIPANNPVFDQYKVEFEQSYLTQTGRSIAARWISISFENVDGRAGVCTYSGEDNGASFSFVKINQRYWGLADSFGKRSVVFHELNHCILKDRSHRDGVMKASARFTLDDGQELELENEIPYSLMNTRVTSSLNYAKMQDAYEYELFTKSTDRFLSIDCMDKEKNYFYANWDVITDIESCIFSF